jgi:general secretion pathway protein D
MKKRIVWLTAAAMAFGLYAQAEVVITSPTGLPDENDVALESAVKAVKEIPEDTVKAVGETIYYTGDELRNTAHGVVSAFKGDTPREAARQDMLGEVAGAWGAPNEIVLRSYKITPVLVGEMIPGGHSAGDVINVASFFASVDFPTDTGAYLWPDSNRLMVRNTRQNLVQLESALSQYNSAEKDYRQVEIKAKFIEVSQSTLNELGFSWEILEDTQLSSDWKVNADKSYLANTGLRAAAGAFGGSTLGAGSMVLTKGGWMPLEVTITALEQNSDSDVLSAPSLTTLNGKAAEIWVGEDRAGPKSFDVNSADINIHIEHKKWSSELMGVNFKVTPEIEKDNMIRLKLNPKIMDILGYDTYQASPNATMLAINGADMQKSSVQGQFPVAKYAANTGDAITESWQRMQAALTGIYANPDPNVSHQASSAGDGTWGTDGFPKNSFMDQYRKASHAEFGIPLNAVNGQLPYFRVREIKTQVVVADGSTVGLGGLIYDRLETYKDKVPVLGSIPLIGRLFRSEGERSIKRNLMIFVSASQVANDGQRKSDVAINN